MPVTTWDTYLADPNIIQQDKICSRVVSCYILCVSWKNVILCKQSAQWIPYFGGPKTLRSIQPEDWKSQCFCSSKAIAHLVCIISFYFLLCPSKYTQTVSDYQAFSPNKNKIIMKWKAFFVSNFERINKINNDNNEGGEKNSTKELIIISIIIITGPLVSVIANM